MSIVFYLSCAKKVGGELTMWLVRVVPLVMFVCQKARPSVSKKKTGNKE